MMVSMYGYISIGAGKRGWSNLMQPIHPSNSFKGLFTMTLNSKWQIINRQRRHGSCSGSWPKRNGASAQKQRQDSSSSRDDKMENGKWEHQTVIQNSQQRGETNERDRDKKTKSWSLTMKVENWKQIDATRLGARRQEQRHSPIVTMMSASVSYSSNSLASGHAARVARNTHTHNREAQKLLA